MAYGWDIEHNEHGLLCLKSIFLKISWNIVQ